MDSATVKTLLTILISAQLVAVTAWAGPPSDDHRSLVKTLLTSARGFPSQKVMLRTGKADATNRILAEMAVDRKSPPRMRLNAIRALEYFPTKRTEEVLMTLLYTKNQKGSFKATCLRALARAFGVRMYFEVQPFLRDPAARVRKGAALALGEIDDLRVKGMLRNHLVHETEINVRLAIEKALEMIDQRAERARRVLVIPRNR